LDYVFTFSNDSGADPIDYVDIGLPNDSYDLNSVTADVNGKSIGDIQQADPSNLESGGSGVTLALGGDAIQPGATGTVHANIGVIRNMVNPYNYNDVKDYASVNLSPTWFTSSLVHGKTNLTVVFILPPGVKPGEPIFYNPSSSWPGPQQPDTTLDSQNRVQYTWSSADANGSTKYTFGAGFPANYVPAAAIVKPAPVSTINIQPQNFCCLGVSLLFILIFGWSIYEAVWGSKKRKLEYLPPKISIEGHGIKRGLTAVEAAILMEQPMDKIMTMILFGVIKKNAATVITKEPLEIMVSPTLPADLQTYETDFLAAFRDKKDKERRTALQEMMVNLVKSVSDKMKGFSRKESIAYYQDIIKRAWEQVEGAGTPEVKSQKYEEVMDWTMLDRNYGDRTRNVFGNGPVFVPIWWGHYDPVFRGTPSVSSVPSIGGSGGGSGQSISMPSLPGSTFAASVINGSQTFAAGALGNVTSFTNSITNRTNPPPPPSTPSRGGWSGGGGGHSCACACACAGCACACAGGGR
jgi:hypothetical protein